MNPLERLAFDRIHGAGPAGGAENGAKTTPTTDFAKLLEELRAVGAQPAATDKAGDAGDFERAVRRADDDYATVMELRRHLEDAYRRCSS